MGEGLTDLIDVKATGNALLFNGVNVSYRELRTLVDRTRTVIDGLDGDGPVGLIAPKSPEAIALLLACWAAGRPFLVPPADLGADVCAVLLRQAGCEHVLHPDGPRSTRHDAAVAPDLRGVGPMLTTSGSTGVPKIVPLPRAAVIAFTDWAADAFDIGCAGNRVVFNYAPLNFDLCLLDVWTTLRTGGQVVLAAQDRAMDARYLLRTFADADVAVVQAVPLFFRRLLDVADRAFPGVREVVHTGDAMPPALLARLPLLFPNARLRNVYGCTETNDSLMHDSDPHSGDAVPVGSPIDGVHTLLLDAEDIEVTGPGSGELLVSTPFQAGRYLDVERTGEAWVERGGRTWFRTGDLVSRDRDGVHRLTGRVDFQVKVRGVRTNPQEVERVLIEHADVVDAVVLAVPDPEAGHRLHALVLAADGAAPNGLTLRSHCARLLPRTAIPSTVELVTEEFPRTSTGKVDRTRLLAERSGERVPAL